MGYFYCNLLCVTRLLCLGCVCTYFCVVNFFDSILRVFRGGNKDASAVQEGALAQGQDTVFGEVPAGPAVAQSAQSSQKRSWITTDGGGGMSGSYSGLFGADSGGVTDYKILGLPPMFSAIRFISEAISMLDRRVAKRARRGGKKVLADHPLSVFFDSVPHPFYTWFDLLQAWVADACLGNGYILIERDRAQRPEQLILVPSGMCTPVYINGTLYYEVSGEILGRTIARRVPYTDMMHLKGFTMTGVEGRQIRVQHRSTMSSAIEGKLYTEGIFRNSARPGIAIKYGQPLDDIERSNVRTKIWAETSGPGQAGMPLILDDGMDVQYLQWSPQEVMFTDFYRIGLEEASMITKVPMDMLFSQNTGTYGAALQRNQNFLVHCIGPWMERISEIFNNQLFFKEERRQKSAFFYWDTSVFLKTDPSTEADIATQLFGSGLVSKNEARERMGLNPVKGGDVMYNSVDFLPEGEVLNVAMAKYLSASGEKGWTINQNKSESTNNEKGGE